MARVLPMPRGRDEDTPRPPHTLPPITSPPPLPHRLTPREEARLLGKLRQLAAFIGRPIVWRFEYMFDHYLGTTPAGVTTMQDYVALREREHYGQL
jgi:hypothetical protein